MQETVEIKKTIMTKNIFTIAIALFSFISFGQNVDFKAGNFKNDKEGFKKASEALKQGEEFFELGNEAVFLVKSPELNFKKALQKFDVAQKFNPNSALLNFKIGVCYANSSSPEKCVSFIKKAQKLDPACDPFLDFYVGYALQLEGKFSEASKSYKKFEAEYKKADNFSKFVTKRKKECGIARDLTGSPIRAWVDNVSELNTEYNDFAPSISTDGAEIIFTSNRPNGNTPNEVGEYDNDIYSSTLYEGKWTKAKPIKGVNTESDDISGNLSFDGTKMLMHREVDGQTDIFESELKGLNWSSPKKAHYQISSPRSNERYAAYSPDGWSIYFNRDNANRSNGYEIMYSSMQSKINKDFKAAQMISTINSKFNEGPVYIHIDGETMYLASEGTGSMGGYDIFTSSYENGTWSKPVNMGAPINTPYDDFFFASTANGKFAYIASNRKGGKGGYDIYKVTFWGEEKQPEISTEDYLLASIANPMKDNSIEQKVDVNRKSFTVFKGKTIDFITKKPVEAEIEITDNVSGKIIQTFTTNSATGKFIITLASGKNYGIAVKADNYLFHSENFDIPKGAADNLVNKVVELKNIKKGSIIALRNIFFDTGKSTLRPESNSELARLVKLMKDVPSLKIEIGGHTDNTGSASLNEKLSADRAATVVNYLTGKGISSSRMTSKGYGSNKPVATNSTSDGRQQNRRTECKITDN